MPGVQKPHWSASSSTKACCTGWSTSPFARPSIVWTSPSGDVDGEQQARVHGLAVEVHRAGAAESAVAHHLGARQVELVPQELEQGDAGADLDGLLGPVQLEGDARLALEDGRPVLEADRPPLFRVEERRRGDADAGRLQEAPTRDPARAGRSMDCPSWLPCSARFARVLSDCYANARDGGPNSSHGYNRPSSVFREQP